MYEVKPKKCLNNEITDKFSILHLKFQARINKLKLLFRKIHAALKGANKVIFNVAQLPSHLH